LTVCMTMAEAAQKRLCPVAAIIGTKDTQTPFCHGPKCGAWRWALDATFRDVVAKLGAETGEKAPFKEASAKVAAKPVSYGLTGYCGLGGAL
jgi:hypothetical protein